MVFVCVSVAIIASPVIKIMASPDFHSAASAVPFLAFSTMLTNVSGFFAFSLLVSDNTRMIAITNIFAAVAITILFLILIPRAGFLGASYAMLISSAVMFAINYILSCRVANLGVSIKPFLRLHRSGHIGGFCLVQMDRRILLGGLCNYGVCGDRTYSQVFCFCFSI